ncbi:MAG TPA: glycosyltransferase [Candidatus Dormibacteraeota bacterium]
MTLAAGVLLVGSSLLLFAFGLNLLYLSWRSLRQARRQPDPLPSELPLVCVQIPVYNERYVVDRVVAAAAALDWPRDRLEIQVLDDSDDETVAIAGRACGRWRARGVRIRHLRRGTRAGYKAGALAFGMAASQAPFFAVLDADFVVPRDFLRRLMGAFEDARVGFAQARWGHLNEDYSTLTAIQALAIDYHFLVEQAVRSGGGFFTNFTGTAGVWRRAAIEDAGGWSAATLTEDLDLSYRAQLRGWRPAFREDLVVPEELPVSIGAYRRQQRRWATGSFQCAFRLLPRLATARLPLGVKVQGAIHLLAYGVGPLMLVQLACYPLVLLAGVRHDPLLGLGYAGLWLNLLSVAPWAGFVVAQHRRGRPWWRGLAGFACQVLGAGMALTVAGALGRALHSGGRFERTPKYRIEERGQEWRDSAYASAARPPLGELALGFPAVLLVLVAAALHAWLIAFYSLLFATGLLAVGVLSAVEALEVVTLRRLGRDAARRLALAGPALVLLLLAGLALGGVAAIGDPFEDSYHHWLISATLAATGQLHDPLFGMEDSWLPAYHLLGATVLTVFGLWNLAALKAANIGLALLTLVLVMRLAGSPRRGRVAAFLLVTNPVFLLTAGSVVAEPLLTLELTAAALAAVSGRLGLAALLAAAAALTGTKAWLWVAVAAIAFLAPRLAGARGRPRAAYWLAPAVAVLVLLQLGFAPATHSVARAAAEVTSAAARGSVAASPAGRLGDFTGYMALACLPLLALAPVGLLVEARSAEGRQRLQALHVPALGYLALVVGLVAVGAYTGSHRYLYPALPALAVLAAAALDRRPAVLTLAAAAAAGLLAVAYLPVFTSFAAGNQGLLRAGAASGRVPGRLLTDSPAAAFASHKPPGQISGSQALPLQPDPALAWLADRGYTSLVVEDIDYYRATEVFSGLAAGSAVPPFQSLGQEADYRAPGGKAVYAYTLRPPEFRSLLAGDVAACLHPDAQPAAGKTASLQKGLILERGSMSLAGEGMGFGAPVIEVGGTWYFPGSADTADISAGGQIVWRKIFQLDRREVDTADGHFQGFEAVPSQGAIQVTYTVSAGSVQVSAVALRLPDGVQAVNLLNEQSAAFDDLADGRGQKRIGAAFGSYQTTGGAYARLRSAAYDLEWAQNPVAGAGLVAEREHRGDIDFAGLEYQFGGNFTGATYTVEVQQAR